MKYISLFSGIEAASVAFAPLGWEPVAFAEVDPFPCAVLRHYWPDVPNLGDVMADDFVDRAKEVLGGATLDVLVFGSPCQGFSISGKRLGLDDPRSNLVLRALGIIRELGPRWFIFENVPGLFSSWSGGPEGIGDLDFSGGGAVSREFEESSDFAAFLQAVRDAGYFGAWSVLDAQWFDVAQRRERVFFVGHAGGWEGPAAVLFEPESVSGDSPPRRKKGEGVAEAAEGGAGGGCWPKDVSPPLNVAWGERSPGSQAQEWDSEGGADLCPPLRANGPGVSRAGDSRGQDPLIICKT